MINFRSLRQKIESEKVKRNIKLLIETARQNGVEIIYVQHDDGSGTGFSKGDEGCEIFIG